MFCIYHHYLRKNNSKPIFSSKKRQKKEESVADSSPSGVYVTRTRDPLRDRQVF